jgi:hypothetical protein
LRNDFSLRVSKIAARWRQLKPELRGQLYVDFPCTSVVLRVVERGLKSHFAKPIRSKPGRTRRERPALSATHIRLHDLQNTRFRDQHSRRKAPGGWQVNPTWRFAGGQPYSVQEGLHSDYSSFSTPFDTTLCDPTQTTGSTPPCRQILANPWALLTPSELQPGDCGLADYYTHLNLRMIQHPLLAEFRSSRCIGS